MVSDGWTGLGPTGVASTFFGCEAARAHHEGGNYALLDGHAKHLKGNIERYTSQDSSGLYYETYLTYDK